MAKKKHTPISLEPAVVQNAVMWIQAASAKHPDLAPPLSTLQHLTVWLEENDAATDLDIGEEEP